MTFNIDSAEEWDKHVGDFDEKYMSADCLTGTCNQCKDTDCECSCHNDNADNSLLNKTTFNELNQDPDNTYDVIIE